MSSCSPASEAPSSLLAIFGLIFRIAASSASSVAHRAGKRSLVPQNASANSYRSGIRGRSPKTPRTPRDWTGSKKASRPYPQTRYPACRPRSENCAPCLRSAGTVGKTKPPGEARANGTISGAGEPPRLVGLRAT